MAVGSNRLAVGSNRLTIGSNRLIIGGVRYYLASFSMMIALSEAQSEATPICPAAVLRLFRARLFGSLPQGIKKEPCGSVGDMIKGAVVVTTPLVC